MTGMEKIMVANYRKSTKKPDEKRYSYADYQNWPNDDRFELIDGVIYNMNAPLRVHQKICIELSRQFANFFLNKTCEVYAAPFDVRLPKNSKAEDEIFDVVQPDLSVICDQKKLDDKGCLGAPDLIVEVLSPSTSSKDHIKKRALYERSGVREYWLVSPEERIVWVYELVDGQYQKPEIYNDQDKIASILFPDLVVEVKTILPPPPPGFCCRDYGIREEIVERKHDSKAKPRSRKSSSKA